MPQSDPSPADQHQRISPVDMGDEFNHGMKGLRNLVERITPWLFAVGSWIFGGLIAFNLVIIASLITVGPVDTALLISSTTFACALPLNLAGIFLLRLIKDMEDIGIEDLTLQAFQDAGHPNIEAYFPASHEKASQHKEKIKRRVGLFRGDSNAEYYVNIRWLNGCAVAHSLVDKCSPLFCRDSQRSPCHRRPCPILAA